MNYTYDLFNGLLLIYNKLVCCKDDSFFLLLTLLIKLLEKLNWFI